MVLKYQTSWWTKKGKEKKEHSSQQILSLLFLAVGTQTEVQNTTESGQEYVHCIIIVWLSSIFHILKKSALIEGVGTLIAIN